MASKNITIKGIEIVAPTKAAAISIYNETIGKDLARLLSEPARDDVQITVGILKIKDGFRTGR